MAEAVAGLAPLVALVAMVVMAQNIHLRQRPVLVAAEAVLATSPVRQVVMAGCMGVLGAVVLVPLAAALEGRVL
jgi:hypothetical protein